VLDASNEAQRLQPHRLLPSHLLASRLGRTTKSGSKSTVKRKTGAVDYASLHKAHGDVAALAVVAAPELAA
jgi:hypothetical protein